MKSLTRTSVMVVTCLIAFACSTTTPKESKILNVPDSVLVNFSYSLFPEGGFHGYIKQTSMYNSTAPIQEYPGSFTAKGAKEVIVAVPYISVLGPFSKLFVVKNEGSAPEFARWFHEDCTRYSIMDFDDDGLMEIIAEFDQTDHENVKHSVYQIFSLANNQKSVIYQSVSQDARESFNLENRIPGDTIVNWCDHTLTDRDNDGTFELTEMRTFVRIEETLSPGNFKTQEMVDTMIVQLKNNHVLSRR